MAKINDSGGIVALIENVTKGIADGTISDFSDPGAPADAGTALTQDDVDFIKTLKKVVREQFIPSESGGGAE